MSEQEPIKWGNLTSEQRDALVAEKVMGQEVCCDGRAISNANYLSAAAWRCLTCGRTWSTAENPYVSPLHLIKGIPAYSTSMDAAWPVMKKMADYGYSRAKDEVHEVLERFTYELLDTSAWADLYPACGAIALMASLTPEKICLAALRAVGVEVEV